MKVRREREMGMEEVVAEEGEEGEGDWGRRW